MKALKVIGVILLVLVVLVIAAGTYVKVALPNTGPAPDLKVELTPKRIARGDYLANHVSACMDCHSQRDWTKYAGPTKNGTQGGGGEHFGAEIGFPGDMYAPNITSYSLKNWTDGEIFRAITTGVSKNGQALFPIMTWAHTGQMDKEDVYSIVAYLRTLNPITKNYPARKLDFPLNFIVNTMPHKAAFSAVPNEKDTIKYGAYLINAAACVDCHSKTDKGAVIPGTEFGGGMEFKLPGGIVHSANITGDKETGIGSWSKEQFVQRFKAFADKSTAASVGMKDFNSPMPWYVYGGMKPSDLEAIYAYLQSIKPIKNKVVKFQKI